MKLYGRQDLGNQRHVPLIYQPYVYTGLDCEAYTNGQTYYPVSSGYHYWREHGFVVWVSSNGHRQKPSMASDDTDDCVAMTVSEFHSNFWAV